MFKSIEATGKTIDLAIQAGLDMLQMDRDSVSVEVLEQPRSGFFGIGASPAKVSLTYEVPDPVPEKKPEAPKKAAPKAEAPAGPIGIEDFAKVKLIAAKIIACEKVEKSDKLLCFTLNDGSGTNRQILSGIAKYYKPEELVGKTVVACTNLAPRKMMGRESNGMLISAEKGEGLHLLMLDDAIPAGAKLC